MFKHSTKLIIGTTLAVLLSTATYAHHQDGHAQGGNSGTDPGNGNDTLIYELTDVDTSSAQYMGMSNKAPPNPHAAASQGTRTQTTTTTTVYEITLEGPKGQLDAYTPPTSGDVPTVGDDVAGCNNCVVDEVEAGEPSVSTETTDLPGANR